MEEILRSLGRRIRQIRTQRGFKSQEEFADYCHMHRTFLGLLETGRKDFRLTTIIRVAQALGVTLKELFSGIEGGTPLKVKSNPTRRRSDLGAILREVEFLERNVERLKQLAAAPIERSPKAGSRRRRRSS